MPLICDLKFLAAIAQFRPLSRAYNRLKAAAGVLSEYHVQSNSQYLRNNRCGRMGSQRMEIRRKSTA